MNKGVREEAVRKDAYEKIMGSCNRGEGAIEEGVYPAVKVTTNSTSVLCREERWEEENGLRLSILK